MFSETSTPPLCPICGEPMKFIKAVPHLGGLPEMFVFYCSRCKQAETKVQKQAV
jgi:C4-type Zn-finger protein